MTDHLIKFHPDAYRGAHITFDGNKGESILCLHFLGDNTADAVLKSLARIIYSEPAALADAPQPEAFDQAPTAWEDTFPKANPFDGVDPAVSSVVRALEADAEPPAPLPVGPLVSGADVPSMKELLEQMQGKFGPGGSPG